jgi:hypothetical protein
VVVVLLLLQRCVKEWRDEADEGWERAMGSGGGGAPSTTALTWVVFQGGGRRLWRWSWDERGWRMRALARTHFSLTHSLCVLSLPQV